MSLSVDELLRLVEIIETNGLSKAEKAFRPTKSNLDRLSEMLSSVRKEYRDTVFELIKHYDIISNYTLHLFNLLKKVESLHKDKIILFPLVNLNSRSVIKSGSHVFYEMKALAATEFEDRFDFYDTPSSSHVLTSSRPKYAVDDFVGSGDQTFEMLEAMREINDQVFIEGVLTIAIMETGYRAIEAKGMRVVFEVMKRKAIDGYIRDEGKDATTFYARYDELEAQLAIDQSYARGYQASEALISMKSTPDNTLPIFWYRGASRKWPAPFPR